MNTFRKCLLIGATALSLGASSFAAQADAGTRGPAAPSECFHGGHKFNGAQRAEFFAKRQAMLHDSLKLSAEQEPAWKAFAASITPPGGKMKRPDRAQVEKLSAPERMEQRLAMMKTAEAHMETRLAAMKTFYATLSPQQQKVFNDSIAKGRPHQGRRHRG
jgi:Spy/CpxP family protein refolding chaperone